MRRWLVIASYDEAGERQSDLHIGPDPSLDVVTMITSGDAEKPEEADVHEALGKFIDDGEHEFLLVPLDAGHTIGVQVKTRVERIWNGGLT